MEKVKLGVDQKVLHKARSIKVKKENDTVLPKLFLSKSLKKQQITMMLKAMVVCQMNL
jgi:hypothetical protein